MSMKQEILADESRFQRVCGAFISHNVIYCVSGLMYSIAQNLEQSSEIFDFDYDEAIGWYQQDDWEEPVEGFICNDADLDQLEWIANEFGDWDDVLNAVGYETYCDMQNEMDQDPVDFAEWLGHQGPVCEDALRKAVSELITEPGHYQTVSQEYGLDPYIHEVYEHWLVDSYFAEQLRAAGEVVFEFQNMTIWGRTTTGQSISIDGVIRRMVRELDEDHWVWSEA